MPQRIHSALQAFSSALHVAVDLAEVYSRMPGAGGDDRRAWLYDALDDLFRPFLQAHFEAEENRTGENTPATGTLLEES